MKKMLLLTALALSAFNSQAVFTWASGTLNATVPDNNPNGWVNTANITTAPIGTVNSVTLNLALTGGWNGDLFAYLVNQDGGFCVLLDRVGLGVSGVGASGYGDAGMNVTLGSSGSSIHGYGGGSTFGSAPSGTWLPDADNTGVQSSANSGNLASFIGANPNGSWTLFIADLGGGGVTTVQSWGLQMDIVAVPEVETWVAAALAGMFGAFWLHRQVWLGIKGA